ncbi:MAG: hypothetical protein MUC99_09275, partial [Anaerolineae bacterium]|nr:hypothetical protein [Anaerolineae bacterium]
MSAQPPAPLNNDPSRIIVKFAEGSGVRLRADGLRSTGNVDLRGVEGVLRAPNVVGVSRLFSQTEAELDQLRQSSNLRSGTPSPDLNLYHVVALSTPTDLPSAQSVLNGLRAQPTVEDAYFAPLPAPLPAYAQTTVRDTPDFLANQDYHDPAPVGIDSAAAWAYVGGRGTGVTVVDVEYEWDFDHEDLPIDPDDRLTGGMYTGFGPDHGTAVLGQIAG